MRPAGDRPGSGGKVRRVHPVEPVHPVVSQRTQLAEPPSTRAPQRVFDQANRLHRLRPDLSASVPIWTSQRFALVAVFVAVVAALTAAPVHVGTAASILLSSIFLIVTLLRILALRTAREASGSAGRRRPRLARTPDAELPTYAVLVAMYDEAAVAPALVGAMAAIDYPQNRLAIRLVVEECDTATRRAIEAIELPPHIQMLVVPEGKPRTKPRALNYALAHTPGEYVVIFDAEDVPERDQLRRAVACFAASPPETGCLQARLNITNHYESWFSRQFTIEYTALFDLMLPTLERHGIPIPLGGTSNHFRRVALEAALAWDPCNVTEDADLGIRMNRFGFRVGILASTTWEEAPATLRVWLGQRTRWMKGWMLTYLVHMRRPVRLARELGAWRFIGFQLYMISAVVSPLVHPWFLGLLIADAASGRLLAPSASPVETFAWWFAVGTLIASYLSTMWLGAVGVGRRGRGWLIRHLVWVPVYWLSISFATYRAIKELILAPHHWEKTPHRARAARPRPATTRRRV